MNEYEFTLKFRLPDINGDVDKYLDALFEAGCDDAIVGMGHMGHIAMEFVREAESVEKAVFSAISAVKSAIDGVTLLEASPDIVGLTDAANLLDVSRQYMRQLRENNVEIFPSPLHSGTSPLYYFTEILEFISTVTNRSHSQAVSEIANINRSINLYRSFITMTLRDVKNSSERETTHVSEDIGVNLGIPEDVQELLKGTHHLAR